MASRYLREKRPNAPQAPRDTLKHDGIDMIPGRDLVSFVSFGRVDDLAHQVGAGRSAEQGGGAVELPAQGVFGDHVGVDGHVIQTQAQTGGAGTRRGG